MEWSGGVHMSVNGFVIMDHFNNFMWQDFYVNNSMVAETLIPYFVLIPQPLTGNSALQKQSKSEERKKKEEKKNRSLVCKLRFPYLMETSASGFPGSSKKCYYLSLFCCH